MITLSMIVKNEEKFLRGCLESVKGIVDEIVIADTGSTDRTIEIAKEYNANVYNFTWIGDFSAARNFSLSKSTGKWILYLDADERLTEESKEELLKLSKGLQNQAYYCNINNIDEITKKPTLMTYVRFFPNVQKLSFEGKVHEQIVPSLLNNKIKLVHSNILIEHLGYSIDDQALKEKGKRNLELLLKAYKESPSSYNAYQLGQTYGILEDKEKTIHYFEIALKDNNLPKEYKSISYRYLGIMKSLEGDNSTALNLLNKSIYHDPTQLFSLLASAKILVNIKNYNEAKRIYYKAFDLNEKLISKKAKTNQNSYLERNTLIYDALSLSIQINDGEFFNYFFKKLKEGNKVPKEINLLNKLINHEVIKENELGDISKCLNNKNIELVLNFVNNYKNKDVAEKIYSEVYELFNKNAHFLIKYGHFLSSLNNHKKAVEVFSLAKDIRNVDPGVIFYLISSFIQIGDIEGIKNILRESEVKYSDQPEIIRKLAVVKEKLKSFL